MTCRSKIVKTVPIGNPRCLAASLTIYFLLLLLPPKDQLTWNLEESIGVTWRSKMAKILSIENPRWPSWKYIFFSLSLLNEKAKWLETWLEAFFFFFFFWFVFYGPFKNISLISSRSFIEGGRKPEYPEKNHLIIRKQNLAFPHMTRARLEPQWWET